MRRHAPFEPIDPNSCVWGGIHDVISCANFLKIGQGVSEMAYPEKRHFLLKAFNNSVSTTVLHCDDDIVCYTDGSRIERTCLAGAGVYVQTDVEELVLPLGHQTSVFQAEVFVLLSNLSCAKLESLLFRNNCSIAICCHSLAAIKAVSVYKATTGLVADAMNALTALATFNSVRLIWVPASGTL